MMGWYGGWGWGAWFGMAAMMLLFWGLIIGAVIAVARSWRPAPRESRGGDGEALRLLDERLARGDIDEEDYRKRRDLLVQR